MTQGNQTTETHQNQTTPQPLQPQPLQPQDAVIVAAQRSPIGKRKGSLQEVHPVDLSAQVLNGLMDKAGVDPDIVDDVYWGCVSQVGEQSINIGRNVVLAAGWSELIPATTIDRQCGSSQQAIHFAAAAVASEQADVVVAGGVEHMTRVPMGSPFVNGPGEPYPDSVLGRFGVEGFNQGIGAEILAERHQLTREWVDQLAVTSHERAHRAQQAGHFDGQIVPITTPDGIFDADEGIRYPSSVEKLGTLKTVFKEDGVVTAGNASQISDGSAAVLVMTYAKAQELGLKPLAKVYATAVIGGDPVAMLAAPGPATKKALQRAGLALEDIGTFECNEAFASVVGTWFQDTGADPEKTNTDGGAIALGHPLGGSGARIATTLIHRMLREGHRFGLHTMCEGGGMANATIYQNLQLD